MAEKDEDVVTSTRSSQETWERLEDYFNENKKRITTIAAVVILAVGGFVGFKYWYVPGQEEDAENAIYRSQLYFNMDSINKAINGDAGSIGFLAIADQYSWTPAGKLANYYLGICYYNKKDYNKAVEYLDKFNSDDVLVGPMAEGIKGDAEMQLNQPDKALEAYMEAIKKNNNNFTAPIYLKKAAQICEMQGKYAEAVEMYERIKSEFHASYDATDIDKYIYRAKAKGGLL
jgi:predicted negative regulator of RcsB-dependent stress response